jgi:Trypsin Inhibitor like cysteine rich domain
MFVLLLTALNCPVDMVASDSASACQPTCDNPTADLFCPHPNSEGCVCPEGQILFEGHCRACCGSYESDGTVRQVRISSDKSNVLFRNETYVHQNVVTAQ